jgi:electron transfer flavoprotein alpha subunit
MRMNILVFSELDDVAFELVAKARAIFPDGTICAALLEPEPAGKENEYLAQGADVVYYGHDPELKNSGSETHASILKDIAQANGIDTVLIGSTRSGKHTASLLSQMLNCGCVTDAIEVRFEEGALQADRYSLAGNTIATETISSKQKVIAIMPHSFKPNERGEGSGKVVEVQVSIPQSSIRILERRDKKGEAVNLEDAKVIVGVGKGFSKEDDLQLARDLASILKAEIGCTRPLAVDLKWLSEDRCIGLSSKKVAPELYFAIGISGQIQHTVGIMRARTIVAINKSEDAPIFETSDYGIVGDLHKVLPTFTQELRNVLKN